MKQALRFEPEHLSCYQLTIEERTPLGIRCQKGEVSPPGEDLQYEFFMKTSEFLEDAGYIHYEVSNFAKGNEVRIAAQSKILGPYSLPGAWTCCPFLSEQPAMVELPILGSLFVSYKLRKVARRRDGDPEYGTTPPGSPLLGDADERKEFNSRILKTSTNSTSWPTRSKILTKLQEEKLVSIQGGYLCPTRAGLAIADSLSLI